MFIRYYVLPSLAGIIGSIKVTTLDEFEILSSKKKMLVEALDEFNKLYPGDEKKWAGDSEIDVRAFGWLTVEKAFEIAKDLQLNVTQTEQVFKYCTING